MQQSDQLAARACKGDKVAFGTLIRTHEASLYRVAKSIAHSDEDCADAIQKAVLTAYRSIHTLDEPQNASNFGSSAFCFANAKHCFAEKGKLPPSHNLLQALLSMSTLLMHVNQIHYVSCRKTYESS